VLSGTVVSARELNEHEKAEFATNLQQATGKVVKLAFSIDKDLIGGAVTRVGSTVLDGSVRSQLANLKEKMIKS
jgi:F-type H+-transporting ATPase subunit delta